MAFFPKEMPAPYPNFDDRDFWKSCAAKRLRFQACARCGAVRHPPTPVCFQCNSFDTEWKETSGEAEVYSFTVIHHASHEAVKPSLPYVVAVVTFPDLPGVRLVTNITDIEPKQVAIGMKASLWWDDIGNKMHIPRFKPSKN